MSDLVEFLLERIAEDEARAHRVRVKPGSPHRWHDAGVPRGYVGIMVSGRRELMPHDQWIAEHTEPAPDRRLLAECEVKRRIVERAALILRAWAERPDGPYPDVTRRERAFADAALTDLAELYADHPEYDPAWRP